MDKFKLYSIETIYSFDKLFSKIVESSNRLVSSYEIHPLKNRANTLAFQFIEKKILETSLLDKDGVEQLIQYLHIDNFEFYIEKKMGNFFLVLKNPPRSLKFFKQTIADILDYKVAISDIEIDPLQWVENIETNYESEFSVISIEIKDVIYNSKIHGFLTLKSQIDLRSSYEQMISSTNFKVSKVLISNNNYFKGKFILCRDASFQLDCLNSSDLIDLLLDNIPT
ncbi:hypothetical protein [Acinetobacter johnsonii]|uniref:Uncharacterized protein n=1 Tax=Acinetobacter johnsonii TaxID=40214 RepID=A0AAV3WFC1_ACIJO|nr:hypothetical protein [Acinetobacter johnsonii]WQE00778.1 hypothetical protein U0040_12890 [Acinetobacter johnsonii]GEK44407.1 hypothetical protein AJO04nite_16650 [Acinetobacter johnsonii]